MSDSAHLFFLILIITVVVIFVIVLRIVSLSSLQSLAGGCFCPRGINDMPVTLFL